MSKQFITHSDLAQFTGTEHWYKHFLGLLYTDGVKFLADEAGAYWLLDKIASLQALQEVRAQPFQLWELHTHESKAALTCGDGDGSTVYQETISFTDFPLRHIKLYLVDKVLMLPSEY